MRTFNRTFQLRCLITSLCLMLFLPVDLLAQFSTTFHCTSGSLSHSSAVLAYIEGSFGAMLMVGAAIGAIVAGFSGDRHGALLLLAISGGVFLLRSAVSVFFMDVGVSV